MNRDKPKIVVLCVVLSCLVTTGCAPINENVTSEWKAGETRQVELDRSVEPEFSVDYVGSSLFEDGAIEISARRQTTCTIAEVATYEKVEETERSFKSLLYPVTYVGVGLAGIGCGAAHAAQIGCLGESQEEGEPARPYTSSEHAALSATFFGLAAASLVVLMIDGARTIDTVDVVESEDRELGQRQEVCEERPFAGARVEMTPSAGSPRTVTLDDEGTARVPMREFDLAAYQAGDAFVELSIDGRRRALGPLPDEWDAERVARFDTEAFEAATLTDTARAYFDYLLRYPDGAHEVEAHRSFQARAAEGASLELIGTYLERFEESLEDDSTLSQLYYERLRKERLVQYQEAWSESPASVLPNGRGLRREDRRWLGEAVVLWHAEELSGLKLDELDLEELRAARRATFQGVDLLSSDERDGSRGVKKLRELREAMTGRAVAMLRREHLEELEFAEIDRRYTAFETELSDFLQGLKDRDDQRFRAMVDFYVGAIDGREKEAVNDPELAFFVSFANQLDEFDGSVSEEALAGARASHGKMLKRLKRKLPMRGLKSSRQAQIVYPFTVDGLSGLREVMESPDKHKKARFSVRVQMVENLGAGSLVKIVPTGDVVFAKPLNSAAREALRDSGMVYFEVDGSMRYVGENDSGRIPKLTAYWGE